MTNREGRSLGLKNRNNRVYRIYEDKIRIHSQYIPGVIIDYYSEAKRKSVG